MIRRREMALWAIVAAWVTAAVWPASFWHDVGEFDLRDFRRGADAEILYTGGPRRPFVGSYAVIVRDATTGHVVAEDKSDRFPYRVGVTRPDPLRVSWWAPRAAAQISALPPGVYVVSTCWTIHAPLWIAPSKTTCTDDDFFEVTE